MEGPDPEQEKRQAGYWPSLASGTLQPGKGRRQLRNSTQQFNHRPLIPAFSSQFLLLLSWLENEVPERAVQSSAVLPALASLAACSTALFLEGKARESKGRSQRG